MKNLYYITSLAVMINFGIIIGDTTKTKNSLPRVKRDRDPIYDESIPPIIIKKDLCNTTDYSNGHKGENEKQLDKKKSCCKTKCNK